jgi:hypothetical protein
MTTSRPLRLLAQLVVIPVLAVVLLAGVWVAGGVVTDDFHGSIALTAAWFAVAGIACAALAVRVPALRVPVAAAYLVVAVGVGGYLGLTTLRDRVVDERVVVGVPASMQPASGPKPARVELARGRFRSGEHTTKGVASVVRLRDGRRFLTLRSFATSPGPDLRVRLTPRGSVDGGADAAVDLGALKGNRGDQQYALPAGTSIRGRIVVIWCRAFSALFGAAVLRPS